MSRYSPTVLPEGRSAFADALNATMNGAEEGYQFRTAVDDRNRRRDAEDEARARQSQDWQWEDEQRGRTRKDWGYQDIQRERTIEDDPYFSFQPPTDAQTSPSPIENNLDRAVAPGATIGGLLGGEGAPSGAGPLPGQYVQGIGFLPALTDGIPNEAGRLGTGRDAAQPVGDVAGRPVYRTGATRQSVLADELESQLGVAKQKGELENDLAVDRYRRQREINAQNPTAAERTAAGNLEERRQQNERSRLEADAGGVAATWARNGIPPEQVATMLQSEYPELTVGAANRIAGTAGKAYQGQGDQVDALYKNVTKLVPPTNPAEEFAARNIAAGRPAPESVDFLMQRGWSQTEAKAIMEYYRNVSYSR